MFFILINVVGIYNHNHYGEKYESIGDLVNLEKLNMSGLRINILPNWFQKLKKLEDLVISSCHLRSYKEIEKFIFS